MNNKQLGVTLIELIMVIIILSILAAAITPLLTQTFLGYFQQKQRYELSNQGQAALEFLTVDAQDALAFSIEVFNHGKSVRFIKPSAKLITLNGNKNQPFNNQLTVISQDRIKQNQGIILPYGTQKIETASILAASIDQLSQPATAFGTQKQCQEPCFSWQLLNIESENKSQLSSMLLQHKHLLFANEIITYHCEQKTDEEFVIVRIQQAIKSVQLKEQINKPVLNGDKSPLINNISHCLFELSKNNTEKTLIISFTHQQPEIGAISLFTQVFLGSTR